MNPMVAAWQDCMDSFRTCLEQVPDDAFCRPSELPGWTIADIVAHVIALEVELSGEPLPDQEPDWDLLPHADDLFSRYTEIGVDFRRGRTAQELRTELDEIAALRADQLTSGPQDPDRRFTGIGGFERGFDEQLGMRCFDIFLHELDIRDALDMPDPVLGRGAQVTADVMAGALGYIWVKRAGAHAGEVLHFVVPGWIDRWIGVREDGKGVDVAPTEPTVAVATDPMSYLRLASGRRPELATASIEGDLPRGAAVVENLNIAP